MDQPRQSHHQRLVTLLRHRITSGEWAPGFRLPFETDLAQDCGVSRMTMNKVLAQLTREGLLDRRRKSGTFVTEPRARATTLPLSEVAAEIQALGQTPGYQPLSLTTISAPEGHPVLELIGLHLADTQPFCLERRWINLGAAPLNPALVPADHRIPDLPQGEVSQTIRAMTPTGAEARTLGITTRSACLLILIRTERQGQWIMQSRRIYPGDRHAVQARSAPAFGQ